MDLIRNITHSIDPNAYPVVPDAAINALWQAIRESQLENRYVYGNCHYRAHLVSLLARAATGQDCFKIWNFPPSKFPGLDGSKLSLVDRHQLTDQGVAVVGFHVAAALRSEQGIRVVDPALDESGPMAVEEWLGQQGNRNSRYTYIDAKYYSFASNDSGHVTGFIEYMGGSRLYQWMPYNLAILDVAMKIIDDEIAERGAVRSELRTFLSEISAVEQVFRDARQGNGPRLDGRVFSFFIKDDQDAKQENRHSFIHRYQDYYDARRSHWSQVCAQLLP
jgi:hypothetical protein